MTISELSHASSSAIGNADAMWLLWIPLIIYLVAGVFLAIAGTAGPPVKQLPRRDPAIVTPEERRKRQEVYNRELERLHAIRDYRSPAGYRNGVKVD